MLHDVPEPRHPGGREAEKDARGFEQRGLALRIRPDEEIQPRLERGLERLEAAEVADLDGAKHGGELSVES